MVILNKMTMLKILKTNTSTTEAQLEKLIKNTPNKLNVVKVTFFDTGYSKYVAKKQFPEYYHHVALTAEIGIGDLKNRKMINFKSVGWKNTLEETTEPPPKEEVKTDDVWPELGTLAYKVWKISEDLYTSTRNDIPRSIPEMEIVLLACKGIDIKKGSARIHYKKWKKYIVKTAAYKENQNAYKIMAKKKAAKKKATAKKKPVKKKAATKKKPATKPAKRGRGRPPGSKGKTKKLSTKKTAKKGTGKVGRPPKKKTDDKPKAPTRSNKSFDQYYKPSSNTSVV